MKRKWENGDIIEQMYKMKLEKNRRKAYSKSLRNENCFLDE